METPIELYAIKKEDLLLSNQEEHTLDPGPFSITTVYSCTFSKGNFAVRIVKPKTTKDKETIFIEICYDLIQLKCKCMMPVSFIIFPDDNEDVIPAICTHFYPGRSLKDIITRIANNEEIKGWDPTQQIITLYGIAAFLNDLHSRGKIHGRLKATNVILDNDFRPLVSDSLMYKMSANEEPVTEERNSIDYIVSLAPETINDKLYTIKADIYSFGIIMLQIITGQINVYYDKGKTKEEILSLLQIDQKITVPESNFSELITECLSNKSKARPNAQTILEKIELICSNDSKYDMSRLIAFKESLEEEEINPNVVEYKKNANKGNKDMMYEYGKARYYGEGCKKDEEEAMRYIKLASEKGHKGANELLNTIMNPYIEPPEINDEQSLVPEIDSGSITIIEKEPYLKDNKYFGKEEFDMNQIIENINANCDKKEEIKFNEEALKESNFIFTQGAKERLTKLCMYIEAGVAVLLEGPTGTSKTISVEIACKLLGIKLIRFNFSSETNQRDLLGRFIGDSNSLAGLSYRDGPFIQAFVNGYTILFDEVNLASQECLQFIEDAIDSGVISIEIPGKPLEEIKMHPEFRLIATQNPNKGLFAKKRKELGVKFSSRVQIIDFPAFTEDELFKIAEGLSKGFKYKGSDEVIKQLVSFHIKWSKTEEIKNDVQCFTIREIAAVVRALADGKNAYDTIMTIYGARYKKEMKEKLRKMLLSYSCFTLLTPEPFEYPSGFPECYQNESLSQALKSIIFSFENNRPVIITGSKGSGITQVARWVANWYDSEHGGDPKNEENFCICTKEIRCADLIGYQKPASGNKETNELIEWNNGFLTNAIEKGKCAVLDRVDEAPAVVTERLNALLDQKYDGEKRVFEVPENPSNNKIEINPNFRLLCTCNNDTIDHMSPAFINRFDVIVLENQLVSNDPENHLDIIDPENLKKLIRRLLINSSIKVQYNEAARKKNNNVNKFMKGFKGTKPNLSSNTKPSSFDEPREDVINCIINKIDPKKSTMFQLSYLCKAVTKYLHFFAQCHFKVDDIVEFSCNMLNRKENFDIPIEFEEFLMGKLKKQCTTSDSKFFFEKSPKLRQFLSKLYAASLIGIPVCVFGPTGIGKTSAARAFACLRPIISKILFQMHSFHAGTKPNHYYGTTTLKDGVIIFINGTLITAMIEGCTFIGDEMNLSPASVMEALAPALEPFSAGQQMFIPGVAQTIRIHEDFFFIACQNQPGTIGRNEIPSSIESRFRYFYYPEQDEEELSSICYDISMSLYSEAENPSFTEEEARNIGKYMIKLNQKAQRVIPQWSLRDITKLFHRIHHQDINPKDYKNISICINVLFYTLSPVNDEDMHSILPVVCELIEESFGSTKVRKEELENLYHEKPKIRLIEGRTYIMKGESGIYYKNTSNLSLESLLNGAFQVLLSDSAEPILFMGASGFKTFLAKQFLSSAKAITLNQDLTVAQLLGSSAFLTSSEAKLFYLETICKICHMYNQYPELKQKLENGELKKEDIEEYTKEEYDSLPTSFHYPIDHLTEKLFDTSENDQEESALSNIKLEFRPGLFLSAILERKSLILKNLHNLPTIIFERFNEMFSGKHNLTINEDIHNTFTNENKELTNFSANFRVFATCPPNSATKLPEPVLSRFTVVYIPEYKSFEKINVLKSYISRNFLKFNEPLISLLINFSEEMTAQIDKTISFPQMINIIEMCSRLNNNTAEEHWINNLGIIIFRVVNGLIENREKLTNKLLQIFGEFDISLPEHFMTPLNEDPLTVYSENGFRGIRSKVTGLFNKSAEAKEVHHDIAFIPMLNEMIDIIHLGLITNTPVIFEGMAGQGKQTAIKYFCESNGYNIINIIISQSTRVEDLLGRFTIERDNENKIRVKYIITELVKSFKSSTDSSNSVIVFHNINKASSAVLEVLVSIFDRHQTDILLPDGSTIKKRNINIIGIVNPQNGLFNRDNLPSSLISSSIYHIVNNPLDEDVSKIIDTLFASKPFQSDAKSFFEKYQAIKKLIAESDSLSRLTLNDIKKYVIFRNETYKYFDETTISQMIFAYRFAQQETIQQVLDRINIGDMKFNPTFTYNKRKREIIIKVSKYANNGIIHPLYSDDIDTEKIQSDLMCLTLPQKHCLLFLLCSLLSKRTCIVQGATASGKSHIIRLFAKMLGQKLIVYQMNNETGMSIFTGQSVLENELNELDLKVLNNAKSVLTEFKELNCYIKHNFPRNIKYCKPDHLKGLLNEIKKYKENTNLNSGEKDKLLSIEKEIKQTFLPANRFKQVESSFIKAMTMGEWVLFDGVESGPAEIIEKVSTLCGDDPELNLCECGEGFYFTRKELPNSKHIHDNFHLFVTYNPISQIETKSLDPSFTDKCVSFTLPPMDSKADYSAQFLIGSLIRLLYPNKFALEIGSRMAMMHSIAKSELENDRDSFADDMQFTGRTLKFIMKVFELYVSKNILLNEIYKPICESIQEFYMNSFIKPEKEKEFLQKLVSEFAKPASDKMNLDFIGMNPMDRYEPLLKDLNYIQLFVTSDLNDFKFSFRAFTQKCMSVQLSDVQFVAKHIRDTIKLIEENCNCFDMKHSRIYENEYPQIKILLRIFEDIDAGSASVKSELTCVPLHDNELLTGKLEKPLSRLKLLTLLQGFDDTNYISLSFPSFIFDETMHKIMQTINVITKDPCIKHFGTLVQQLSEHKELFPFVDSIFPYNNFIRTSFKNICYWLPMILELHKAKTTFHVIVDGVEYIFEYSSESEYQPTYVFNEEDELILSPNTRFEFRGEGEDSTKKFEIDESTEREELPEWSPVFYILTLYLIKYPKNITLEAFVDQIESGTEFPDSPRAKQKVQSSLLFNSSKQKTLLIAKVWGLVYTIPNESRSIINVFLHPLEKEILDSAYGLFEIINKKSIEKIFDFTKSLENFGSENSILWQIMNKTYSPPEKNDLERLKAAKGRFEVEIKKLKETPIINEKIWSSGPYITSLTAQLNQIDDYIGNIISKDENLRIGNNLNNLIEQLNAIKITKDEYIKIRDKIIRQIKKIKEKPLTQAILEICEKQVNNFKETLANLDEKMIQNNIIWPHYISTNDIKNVSTNTTKIFEHIIWYSRVSDIYEKILDKKNENIMESIILLDEFTELQSVTELLISRLMNSEENSESQLIPEDIDAMRSTLNAHFIMKMLKDNLFSKISELDSILNKLADRDAITDEREIIWIHQKANQIPYDFNIILPHFTSKDLFFLLVSYKGDKSELSNGPLLQSKSNKIALSLGRYINSYQSDNTVTIKQSAEFIAKKIYRIAFECKEEEIPQKIDAIMNKIDSLPKQSEYRVALSILNIGNSLISKNYKLTFDDVGLLNKNCISDAEFVNKYPSLVYWLCKNTWCGEQIQSNCKGYKFEDDKLPFWLFVVRLMSAKNCVKFTSKSQTAIGVLIRDTINKEVQSTINESTKPLGTDWLNLLLPTLPNEIAVHEYKMFYNFLINISEEADLSKSLIQGIKEEEIKRLTKSICSMVFNGNAKDLLSSKLSTANKDILFLKDPKEAIKLIINTFAKNTYNRFLQSNALKNLNDYSDKNNSVYTKLITELDSESKKQIEERKQKIEEEKKELDRIEKEKIRNDLTNQLSEYKKELDFLSSGNEIEYTELAEHMDNLYSLCAKISTKLLDCNTTQLEGFTLEYKNLYDMTLKIKDTKGVLQTIPIMSGSGKMHFSGKFISEETIQKCKFSILGVTEKSPDVEWHHKDFHPIKTQNINTIMDEICNKRIIHKPNVQVPILLFNNQYDTLGMIQILENVMKTINDAINCVNNDFNGNKATDETFSMPYEAIKEIKNAKSYMNVEFSDHEICPKIQNILDRFSEILDQYKNYFQKIAELIQAEIEPKLKDISKVGSSPIVGDNLKLPLPKTKNVDARSCINFSNIGDANFLSAPILTSEKDESIFCCFSSLHCLIVPIVTSMYSKDIVMNFVSFINEKISINVETDEKHKDWFKGTQNASPGEMVQILISLPKIEDDKSIEEKIDTVIKVTSPKLKALSIPCVFNVKLLPLSILFSCVEYQIAYKNGKYILCTNKVPSDSNITFSIQNYNISENTQFCYQLISLDDNHAKQPTIHKDEEKNKLQLHLLNVDAAKRIHLLLKIAFTERFSIDVVIDAVIVPFVYSFDIYDYTQNRYVNDIVEVPYSINAQFILHCRVFSPSFSSTELKGIIQVQTPDYVTSYKGTNFELPIKENTEFEIPLNITRPQNKNKESEDFVRVIINGTISQINIKFTELSTGMFSIKKNLLRNTIKFNQDYIKQFNVFKFKGNAWVQVKSPNEKIEEVMCVVSAFHCHIKGIAKVGYEYNSCKVEDTKNNQFICMNENGDCSIEKKYYIKDTEEKWNRNSKTTIYSIAGINQKYWYPFYNYYPPEFNGWIKLEIIDENISVAEIRYKNLGYNYGFYKLAELLKKPSVIKAFDQFYSKASDLFEKIGFKDQFREQINFAKSLKQDDKKLIIVSHNITSLLFRIFSDRYNEISKNHFYLYQNMPDYVKKSNECYRDFVSIKTDTFNDIGITSKFIDFEKSFKEIKVAELPLEHLQKEAFLITGNTEPVSKYRTDTPQIEHKIFGQENKAGDKEIKFGNLSEIKIPEESKFGDLSILELKELYDNCIQGTRILPIFIRNMKIQRTESMEKEAINYINSLVKIYNILPEKDCSIISASVNAFRQAFAAMVGKLKKAKIDLNPILEIKCTSTNEEEFQGFLQYPEKDKPYLPMHEWTTNEKESITSIQTRPAAIHTIVGLMNLTERSNDNDNNDENDISFEQIQSKTITKPKESVTAKHDERRVTSEAENIVFCKILKKDDKTDDGKDHDKKDDSVAAKAIVITNDSTCTKAIETEQFDRMVPQFTESDGIERAVARMKDKDDQSNFTIPEQNSSNFILELLKPDIKNFKQEDCSIIKLIDQSYFISQEFIKIASDQKIPFTNMAANILVDCSSYICNENKIFNMLLICALTNALTAIEIPYSVAVVADQSFRCIIKPFDEPHSCVALQRICECLLINRYRTKLASAAKFAIDKMQYNSNRTQRAIFTFSDGLDEQLVQTNTWVGTVLNDPNNSFGYVFIKSSKLKGDNLTFVENVWRKFEHETRMKDAKSSVKIASIKAELSTEMLMQLSEMFSVTMRRPENAAKEDVVYEKALFSIDTPLSNLEVMKSYLKTDYSKINGVYAKRTNALDEATSEFGRHDSSQYRNLRNNIISCKVDSKLKKEDVAAFTKEFVENIRRINRMALESIFKPNKATQTELSRRGNILDVFAVVLNSINPVPDPMIYLEEKGGLIRNYRVSVVIDPSISCFHDLSGPHTFQTIKIVLSYLASLDLPCFDLIVAGNPSPTVICSDVRTQYALSCKSPLWESLFAILQNPLPKADLASAVRAAFDLRMRSAEYTSIMLVLTDGLYQESERKGIRNCINNCVKSGMTAIGIGVGIYPKGITELFPQVVFSPNPLSVMKGVATFFGDNSIEQLASIPAIGVSQPESAKIKEAIEYIIKNREKQVFSGLVGQLHDIRPLLDAFDDMYNEEQTVGNDKEGYFNPTAKNTEMYTKNLLESQKILIVMLWDCTMSEAEESFVHKDYIFRSSEKGRTECIKTAVEYFGIDIVVVQDYEAAINEITKQTTPGCCDYYAVWVICGPKLPVLPDEDADPHLVGQFNEVLIKFWHNGGSIVFWAEGDPLTYQVNLFLETVRFDESECPSGKTNLRIGSVHEGRQTLSGVDSGDLSKAQSFNRSPQLFKNIQRTSVSHNLFKIFEGITISYAPYDESIMKPFKPFSRDSAGGVSSLFYCANLLTGVGDIFIDCGYTKLFTKMTSDMKTNGTFRYVQNIAGWTARPEVHTREHPEIQPRNWRPTAVSHEIKKVEKWHEFKDIEVKKPAVVEVDVEKLKTLWAIDCSGSVRNSCLYHKELKKIVSEYYKKGDDIWLWGSETKHYQRNKLDEFMNNMDGWGGTNSALIADIAQASSLHEHLLIVTDGHVDSGSIDNADTKMMNSDIRFKAVTTFIIGSGGDLSVGAPYSRGCQNKTFAIRSENGPRELVTSLNSADLKALENIETISTYKHFISCYPKLERAIQAKTLGKAGDETIRKQLSKLHSRVTNSPLNSKESDDFESKYKVLHRMATGSLRETFNLDSIAAAKRGSV